MFAAGSARLQLSALGGQLAIAHMYLIAVFVRNAMGSASHGTNGLQRWHAEFVFLLGASITGVVLPAVLSDPHHIHGFSSRAELLDALQSRENEAQRTWDNPQLEPKLRVDPREAEQHLRRRIAPKVRRAVQRTRKGVGRHQAVIIFAAFAASELLWFITYAVTIWSPPWSAGTKTWQPDCDKMIGRGSYALIQGVSFTFVSLSSLFTLLLIIPVFFPQSRYESAAHFIALLFSHHNVRAREVVHRSSFHSRNLRKRLLRAAHGLGPRARLTAEEPSPKAEARVRILLSVLVWLLWFGCILYVLFSALEEFLLVGTSTSAAWPYAAIQNFMFGFFPLAKFFLNPRRQQARRGRCQ
ncbi:hypothetical protein JCM3774_001569 [Rhodotorula dairenensis]